MRSAETAIQRFLITRVLRLEFLQEFDIFSQSLPESEFKAHLCQKAQPHLQTEVNRCSATNRIEGQTQAEGRKGTFVQYSMIIRLHVTRSNLNPQP